jgi:hypothetical protein
MVFHKVSLRVVFIERAQEGSSFKPFIAVGDVFQK